MNHAYCLEKRQASRFTSSVTQLWFTQNIFITQHMFILYSPHTSDLNSPLVALFILALVVTMVVVITSVLGGWCTQD